MNKAILAVACVLALVLAASADEKQACGFNEVYQDCGTMCPEHCPVRDPRTGELDTGANRPCILMCKQGCFCAAGTVRDLKRNGACVQRALCSAP